MTAIELKKQNFTLSMYSNLNKKYQSNFNFYFSKAVNQIVFNQTTALNTILFKDVVIYAESTQYLKRQYFLVNALGHNQIFDRIGMLSQFYTGAIILRYEYPLMILTKTKQIFLKRLKRYKHMLNEEGSSDQSKSNEMSRSIELHVDTFLDSVNSSELSKKTAQLNKQLFSAQEYSRKENSFQIQTHHVYNPQNHEQPQNSLSFQKQQNHQESFAEKMLKLSKNISLIEMVGQQAIQLNLAINNFTEIGHLVCDFDQIDVQDVLKKYEKVPQKFKKKDKKNKNILYQNFHFQKPQSKVNNQNIFIIPLNKNGDEINSFQFQQPRIYKTRSKQMQRSVMSPSDHYEPEWKKRSQFHQTKRHSYICEEQNNRPQIKYQQLQYQNNKCFQKNHRQPQIYSPRYVTSANYQPIKNINSNEKNTKFNIKQTEKFYQQQPFSSMTKDKFFNNYQNKNITGYRNISKISNNFQQNQHLPSSFQQEKLIIHANNLNINYHDVNNYSRQKSGKHVNTNFNKRSQITHIKDQNIQNTPYYLQQNYQPGRYPKQSYKYESNKVYNNYTNQIPITQFHSSQQRKAYHSPKFKDLKDSPQQRSKRLSGGTNLYQNYKSDFKKVDKNEPYQKINSIQDKFQAYGQIQKVQLQKLQKKRKIRQKAAQLLNRVKSQQYLINRGNLVQSNYKNY